MVDGQRPRPAQRQRRRRSEHLKQLAWLIGEWIDESPESLVTTSYRWDDNHTFMLSDFEVKVAGRPVMSGTQRIGWDPLAKTIRSWVFDSEGGFAEGVYSHAGNRWIVKLTGVTQRRQTRLRPRTLLPAPAGPHHLAIARSYQSATNRRPTWAK